MNNKVIIALLLIIVAIFASLFVQNHNLYKRLDELQKQNQEIKAKQIAPEAKPANPAGASPFDKPNVDPMADKFNPTGSAQQATPSTINFDHLIHDFGRITEGDIVNTKFKFTNTGDKALLILHAQASCGCTVPDWPRYPVKPGDSAEIAVVFNSTGKHGEVTKTITVSTNATVPFISLTIKATVVPKEK